jgi:hypothetical protein
MMVKIFNAKTQRREDARALGVGFRTRISHFLVGRILSPAQYIQIDRSRLRHFRIASLRLCVFALNPGRTRDLVWNQNN